MAGFMSSLPEPWVVKLQDARTAGAATVRDLQSRLLPGNQRIFRIEGAFRGDKPGVMAAVMAESCLHELSLFLFNGEAKVEELGTAFGVRRVQQIPSFLLGQADVIVTEAHMMKKSASPPDDWVAQPWMSAVCKPGTDYDGFLRNQVSENVRRNLKKAEALNLTIRSSSTWQDAEKFYETLMKPFVLQRFDKGSEIAPLGVLLDWYEGSYSSGEVLFLERNGQAVAGAAVVHRKPQNERMVWAYGAKPEILEDKVLRSGFTALLNAHLFRQACQTAATVNLGFTRPFLDDGLRRYKEMWGCHLQPSLLMRRFRLRLTAKASPEIRNALAMTPLE